MVDPGVRREERVADAAAVGQRLDRWLSDQSLGLTRSRIQRLIEQGEVEVDGHVVPGRTRLRGGERVVVVVPAPRSVEMQADPTVPFEILYEDDDLAVIVKPAGVVVHPAPGHREGTLVHGLMARLDRLSGVGGRARPGLVHRLDRDTSGLMVVAKTDAAHNGLADQLRDRSLGRIYRAIVWGTPDPPKGRIDLPLDRDPKVRERRRVVQTGGRRAITDFRLEFGVEGASLLRLRLRTGRTHQIRVHLAHRGHPVLGDTLYGGGESRLSGAHPSHRLRLRAALVAAGRQALHACELAFTHPRTGEALHWRVPLPDDLARAWAELGGPEIGLDALDRPDAER